jgi:pimeloyl-ACP methyl ester carboxylesterase
MPLWLMLAAMVSADTGRSFMVPVGIGESLHVSMIGRGEPIVLIPGFFGSAFGFRKLVPMLEQAGYQTVIIEPLGMGWSGRPKRADYSFLAQADRIAAVMDTLHIRNALVVGHGVSGATAFRLAYRRKDLVAALLSLEGGPTEKVATPEFRRAAQFLPWVKLFGGIKLLRRVVHRELVSSSGDASWITDSVVVAYTAGAAADLDGTLMSYQAMAAAKERDRLEPHLREILCPVRLLFGTAKHDGNVEPDEVAELRRTLRSFALDSVPGAGHYLQEEHPEAIMRALALTRASAGMPLLKKPSH